MLPRKIAFLNATLAVQAHLVTHKIKIFAVSDACSGPLVSFASTFSRVPSSKTRIV